MTSVVNGTGKTSGAKAPAKQGASRIIGKDPRYGIISRKAVPEHEPLSLVADLKALGQRGGSVIGAAYAWAASSILNRVERLEDLNAERRFEHRTKAARSKPPTGGAEAPPNVASPSVPSPKTTLPTR